MIELQRHETGSPFIKLEKEIRYMATKEPGYVYILTNPIHTGTDPLCYESFETRNKRINDVY